jgi:hypothetical protein
VGELAGGVKVDFVTVAETVVCVDEGHSKTTLEPGSLI